MNPFENQKAYGVLYLGPYKVPGIILEIEGCDREYVWEVKKPISTGGADADFKGVKVADGIRVKSALVTAMDFLDLATFRKNVTPPKGKKPSAFDVRNAIFTNNGIKSAAIRKIGQEHWEGEGGKGLWTFMLELLEYDPAKKTAVGAVGGSKSGGAAGNAASNFKEEAQSAADKEIEDLLKKAKAA